MPKLKSNKSARWRFKVTGTGKLMRRKCGKSHLMSNKTKKQRRALKLAIEYVGTRRFYLKRLLLAEGK
ncbi:MAG: 50S ribosomal protein L35 [Candidatus Brocadiae bacterium]|nr:50S ribosomal protein L35 [Candidatus Brocadiia bacterium]